MERTGAIADYTHIWWDVRVHAKLGTIELRICDAVTNIDDVIAITAYFQALVKRYSEDFDAGRKLDGHHRILTVENKFLAARYGLEARVMDLATGASERVPISELVRHEVVRRTYRDLVPHARELGSEAELEGIDEILSRGNGADRQLRIWNANRDITEVVRDLAKTTEVGLSRVP
jgi:glutamate---cysteine ligase / carboxylate-amine ligase